MIPRCHTPARLLEIHHQDMRQHVNTWPAPHQRPAAGTTVTTTVTMTGHQGWCPSPNRKAILNRARRTRTTLPGLPASEGHPFPGPITVAVSPAKPPRQLCRRMQRCTDMHMAQSANEHSRAGRRRSQGRTMRVGRQICMTVLRCQSALLNQQSNAHQWYRYAHPPHPRPQHMFANNRR